MSSYHTITAFCRHHDGTLSRTPVVVDHNDPGRLNIGNGLNAVNVTWIDNRPLKGWGKDDGNADIYMTESGYELLIPQRFATIVAKHLAN